MKEYEIRPKELFNKYLELSRKDAESFDKNEFESIPCISCQSVHLQSKIIKDGFNYDICEKCGTVFCNPRPTFEMLNSFYKNSDSAKFWFEKFLPKVEEVRRDKIFRKKAEQLLKLLQERDLKVKNLCDIGAGSGIFIEELKKINNDIEYFAIEPGNVSYGILQEKGINSLNLSVEDATEWHNKFDFAVSLEVFEHVNKPIDFVTSVYNLLADGGYCLVTSLCYEGFDILTLQNNSNSISPPHHLNFPSIEGYRKLFMSAGFSDVMITTPGVLDVDIVLNSNHVPEFLTVLKSRGNNALQEFQDFLVKHQMSSHIWVLARK